MFSGNRDAVDVAVRCGARKSVDGRVRAWEGALIGNRARTARVGGVLDRSKSALRQGGNHLVRFEREDVGFARRGCVEVERCAVPRPAHERWGHATVLLTCRAAVITDQPASSGLGGI